MTPKDLFQTSLRIAGVILLYFAIPRALADLMALTDSIRGQGAGGVLGLLFRLLWEIGVPIWLVSGAGCLTRRIYSSN